MVKEKSKKETSRDFSQERERSKELDGSTSWKLDFNELLTVIGHDLQEPLRKIRSFSQNLLSDERERMSEQGLDRLQRLVRSVRRLEDYVVALLAYSRGHQGPLELRNVDLGTMVKDVLGFLGDCNVYDPNMHEIVIQPLPIIIADEMQMRMLFQNLIGNALKFSKEDLPGQQHRVCIRSKSDSEKCMVEIEVEDNGVGFEPHLAERIFTPFYRIHGNRFGGTGLGLSLCRSIVERHCGQINAFGVVGEGACFRILLPLNLDLKLRMG